MQYKLQEDGLYALSGDHWQRVGGWIQVMARTRLTDKRHGHGALLEWQNFDGVKLREVVYARDLNSDNARQVRDMLVDTGYPLTPGQASWSRLQHYLLEQIQHWHGTGCATYCACWYGKWRNPSGWSIVDWEDDLVAIGGQRLREQPLCPQLDLNEQRISGSLFRAQRHAVATG